MKIINTDGKITIQQYAARNKDLIILSDDNPIEPLDVYCGNDLIKRHTELLYVEVEKLKMKAIYTQCTTEELKQVKTIIDTLLEEREGTPNENKK